jgi:hypothetical protein
VAHADAAMGEAKRAGGNTWAQFEERLEGPRPEMLGLQNDLRFAIENVQLELHYQPNVDGRSGAAHGVEALLRWVHPEHGFVSPAVFIPLAERFGLICKLGTWVFDEACRQVEACTAGAARMNVAINLSVRQLRKSRCSRRRRAEAGLFRGRVGRPGRRARLQVSPHVVEAHAARLALVDGVEVVRDPAEAARLRLLARERAAVRGVGGVEAGAQQALAVRVQRGADRGRARAVLGLRGLLLGQRRRARVEARRGVRSCGQKRREEECGAHQEAPAAEA